jgi:hypothetical protein
MHPDVPPHKGKFPLSIRIKDSRVLKEPIQRKINVKM